MWGYIWPLGLVVVANLAYHICAKSAPESMDPLASLTVTYLVASAASAALFFALHRGGSLIREYTRLSWAPFVLGLAVVGLEAGYLYAYKAGWQVGTAQIVQSAILAAALIFVGFMLYHEALTWNKLVGVAVCLIGLALINYK